MLGEAFRPYPAVEPVVYNCYCRDLGKLTAVTSLSLSGCHLAAVPPQIASLTQLQVSRSLAPRCHLLGTLCLRGGLPFMWCAWRPAAGGWGE